MTVFTQELARSSAQENERQKKVSLTPRRALWSEGRKHPGSYGGTRKRSDCRPSIVLGFENGSLDLSGRARVSARMAAANTLRREHIVCGVEKHAWLGVPSLIAARTSVLAK